MGLEIIGTDASKDSYFNKMWKETDWKKAVERAIRLHRRYVKALEERDTKRQIKIEKQLDFLYKTIVGDK